MFKDIKKRQSSRNTSSGFSILELMVVLLILAIILTFSVVLIVRSRTAFQFSNSVTELRSYLERAISDARRRNAKGGARPSVRVLDADSYEVRIDNNGDGNPEVLTVDLPPQIRFLYDTGSPPRATIDWRGNIAEGDVSFVLRAQSGEVSEIKLTRKGDASTDSEFPVLPIVTVTPVSTDVEPSTVLVGNTVHDPNVSPTPTPTPLPVCAGKQMPEPDNCRCKPGKVIDNDGKCK